MQKMFEAILLVDALHQATFTCSNGSVARTINDQIAYKGDSVPRTKLKVTPTKTWVKYRGVGHHDCDPVLITSATAWAGIMIKSCGQ